VLSLKAGEVWRFLLAGAMLGILLFSAGCGNGSTNFALFGPPPSATPTLTSTPSQTPPPTATRKPTRTPTPLPSPTPSPTPLRFAIIGDFGLAGQPEKAVADLVQSWSPAFIVTTGDNNYPSGAAETIDQNIGQYFYNFIAPYKGKYGEGAQENRFFPVLGNHDWVEPKAKPYLAYFTLPGNERYYTTTYQTIGLFMLDSDPNEPDGIKNNSVQAQWLKEQLAKSSACWKLIFLHHPPFSSGFHGSNTWMQWPFQEWGADAVFGGHDHHYERFGQNGFPSFVNGLGGGPRYLLKQTLPGSEVRYNANHGAMLAEVTGKRLTLQFITISGEVIDTYSLEKSCPGN